MRVRWTERGGMNDCTAGSEADRSAGGSEPADPVATRLFTLLVRRSAGVTELAEALLGRAVRSRRLSQDEIPRIRAPGLLQLRTTGPVLHRHVLLEDSLPPHLPVAVAWALIVPWHLPEKVRSGLLQGDEPLDRLLTRHGLLWTTEPVETETRTVAEASSAFPWACRSTPLVEHTRRVLDDGGLPIAVTIDEVPLLAPRTDPGLPLLPC
jgi:chorismate-pyruvate lyase